MAYVIFLRVLVGLTLIVRRKNLDPSGGSFGALGPICVVFSPAGCDASESLTLRFCQCG